MQATVYGDPEYVYGHVIATLGVSSHEQARLMMQMLEREMRERAGTPAEQQLARWYNHLAATRRKAERESWRGWTSGRLALAQEGEKK